jgi:hypothetical protein
MNSKPSPVDAAQLLSLIFSPSGAPFVQAVEQYWASEEVRRKVDAELLGLISDQPTDVQTKVVMLIGLLRAKEGEAYLRKFLDQRFPRRRLTRLTTQPNQRTQEHLLLYHLILALVMLNSHVGQELANELISSASNTWIGKALKAALRGSDSTHE